MRVFPVKTPELVKGTFSNYQWDVKSDKKEIYLTFDDGPTPIITPGVLNLLSKYNAKATFFCIGKNIVKHPDIYQKIIDHGQQVGNHTYSHLKGWQTSNSVYIGDVIKCQETISNFQKPDESSEKQDTTMNVSVGNKKLFRPPYGKIGPMQSKLLRENNYKIVMWDILTYDWDKTVSPDQCLRNVIDNATGGSIVVFHDSLKARRNLKYALPEVLKHYTEKGYVFKKLD